MTRTWNPYDGGMAADLNTGADAVCKCPPSLFVQFLVHVSQLTAGSDLSVPCIRIDSDILKLRQVNGDNVRGSGAA
jgi:hypothetical protein